MEQLIELLKQIQELAGVAIDALEGAGEGGGENPSPAGGEGAAEGGAERRTPAAAEESAENEMPPGK
jgi:hypothetical protein